MCKINLVWITLFFTFFLFSCDLLAQVDISAKTQERIEKECLFEQRFWLPIHFEKRWHPTIITSRADQLNSMYSERARKEFARSREMLAQWIPVVVGCASTGLCSVASDSCSAFSQAGLISGLSGFIATNLLIQAGRYCFDNYSNYPSDTAALCRLTNNTSPDFLEQFASDSRFRKIWMKLQSRGKNLEKLQKACLIKCVTSQILQYERCETYYSSNSAAVIAAGKGVCTEFSRLAYHFGKLLNVDIQVALSLDHAFSKIVYNGKELIFEPQSPQCEFTEVVD